VKGNVKDRATFGQIIAELITFVVLVIIFISAFGKL
jgi:hypothetical protein